MQKNKQELEILRHKVENLQIGGGGSGDSYTKAQTNALLSAKADKSDTYTKAQTNSAISSAIGDVFADDPIVFVEDQETDKIYFPTDKVDILRLHKPFMYNNKVWYCVNDETGYGWVYFTVNTSNNELEMSELYYMRILDETKEVLLDYGEVVEKSEDLTAAVIAKGGRIDSGDVAKSDWYLDRVTSNLNINFTATSKVLPSDALITFDSGLILPWNPFQTLIIAFKGNGSLIVLQVILNASGFIDRITTTEEINSGDVIRIIASCTVNKRRAVFDNL